MDISSKSNNVNTLYFDINTEVKSVWEVDIKFGKNAVLKGMNLEEGAMTRERNGQIGGHKA